MGAMLVCLAACQQQAARSDGCRCKPTVRGLPGETITSLVSFAPDPGKYRGYNAVNGLATDGQNLYGNLWAQAYFPDIVRLPVGGGEITTLFHGINVPYDLVFYGFVIDTTNVYWHGSRGVWQVPKAGGAATLLKNDTNTGGVAVDATSVYWTNYLNINKPTTTSGLVLRMPIGGGTATTLFAGPAYAQHIVVDSRNIYWTAYNWFNPGTKTGTVLRLPVEGGTPVTLAQSLETPTGLVLDEGALYWSDLRGKAIMKVPIDGGEVVTLASSEEAIAGFAITHGQLYWTSNECGLGYVARTPTEGGDMTVVATDVGGPIAVDDNSIYLAGGEGLAKVTPR